MSIESQLNRSMRRAVKAANGGDHLVGGFTPSVAPGMVYDARCLRSGCKAIVAVTSTFRVVGDATFTMCDSGDPYAGQLDAPSAEESTDASV